MSLPPMSLPPMSIINNTYGAFLLGSLVATFLSGMNTLQSVLYFRLFPKDPNLIKVSVLAVWCLDIAHTVLIWVAAWSYFIVNIGHLQKIDEIMPELIPGATVVTAVVTLIVHLQVFLSHASLTLTRHSKGSIYNVFSPSVIGITGFVSQSPEFKLVNLLAGGAMATTGEWVRSKRFSVFEQSDTRWVLSLALVFGAATDLSIMVAMFVLLKTSRIESISLNNVIDKLILYTLEIGSVAAATAVASMIAWFVSPHTLIFGAIYLCIEKVYAISFMGLYASSLSPREKVYNPFNQVKCTLAPETRGGSAKQSRLENEPVYFGDGHKCVK
ncbi:hypothetical protein M378DRAFT_24918 [Amanita muscaria Koide BX008]|uniref:DUF6534 domain-containing protein n=1 Tax=Amanita muscaria (strain Koide BX008) TaxID=946122 RepID=A0A0C2TAG0_AMAMK|nr:hypothetical protein M378DRAFT_24918 [Amanita muscaria Koide BX008]